MNFLDKLDILMKKNNLNKKRLSEKSGIPYSTIDSFYKQSYNNIKLSTFKKVCDYFGITMDSMARDELEIEYYNPNKNDFHITKEEEFFLQYYRAADDIHKGLAACAVGADQAQDTQKKDLNAG
ncbi:MAG: helix-turn-helix transcriptional regulator [Lachnospiraceae bacterium]|nr:helix-turn-helix transcriptional regulator [Lachnospiraceae bacterium]